MTTNHTDLIRKLRDQKEVHNVYSGTGKMTLVRGDFIDPLCSEAADALEVMQSETARLVEKSNAYIIDNARFSNALDEMRDAHTKERESLRMMLSDALSALEYHQEQTRPIHSTKVAIDMIRRGIA